MSCFWYNLRIFTSVTSHDVLQDYGPTTEVDSVSEIMAPAVVNMCINIVKWTPVLFITAVLVWSYYAYVLQMCLCK